MTDKELIARLRKADEYEPLGHDGWEAADRIEALTSENAKLHDHIEGVAKNTHKIMVGYEAKLAKAVEIGNKMAHSIEGNYYLPNIAGEWRKVAAEIKGESHE